MSGKLEKLKIEAWSKPDYKGSPASTFTVMFNPSTYTVKYALEYDDKQGKGTAGKAQKYTKSKPTEFSLDFVLDGTGAAGETTPDVATRVGEFLEGVYRFDGEIHRPRFVKLAWGTLVVTCVFTGASIKYDLFSPGGMPLRATVSASFLGHVADPKRVAEQGNSSPDLFRVHVVREGETLPWLCQEYYGAPHHYLELARYNGLNNFRALTTGQRLVFPPLAKA